MSGEKISIATDLGHIDSNTIKHLKNSSSILLEANYDPNVLKLSSYPYYLKQRIAGPKGHLANHTTGNVIGELIGSGLKNALLVHLSKESNFPELALQTVKEQLIQNNHSLNNINISVAPRNTPSVMFTA
jgi:phosphoribosyl 1,2-cyclic phosphodiesterase